MLSLIIKPILTIVLGGIAGIHMYWMCGGQKGLDASLPHDIMQIKQRMSAPLICIIQIVTIVPVVFVLMGLIVSLYPEKVAIVEPHIKIIYGGAALLFLLRGLGGGLLNKMSKKAIFIRLNSTVYSPLSAGIGIGYGLLYSLV